MSLPFTIPAWAVFGYRLFSWSLNIPGNVGQPTEDTLYDYDANGYIVPAPGRTIPITPEEQRWIDRANAERARLDNASRQTLDLVMRDLFPYGPQYPLGDYQCAVSPTLGTTPDPLVKTIRYVDPLILDLDGDGLEIIRVSRTPPVLFDADADLVKTATAWAGPDDALLALDLDGNGTIDSGRELFGDETLLPNGSKAAHGFAALRALDSNADNLFSALDAQFTAVRLWRDLDQDGISDAGELLTLAESGVQSINLVSTTTNVNYGDALLVQSGSFTRSSGASGQAGSFILAQNNFVTEFVPIAVNDAARALPNIGGSGWVRDLQEAATLNADLIALANTAKAAPTRAGYKTAVADLLREWGSDSAFDSASEQALRAGYGLVMSDPLDEQERGWMDVAVKGTEVHRVQRESGLQSTHPLRRHARRGQSGRGCGGAYVHAVRAACAAMTTHPITGVNPDDFGTFVPLAAREHSRSVGTCNHVASDH